ncbi:hypothetical protein LTR12_017447 [Friedmanniomyces endolithicus]|nr:hypothetical protein LTR12_017447 [Friedmanniomyces endolithicus]
MTLTTSARDTEDDEPPTKRRRLRGERTAIKSSQAESEDEKCTPVAYWVKHDTWPPNFAEKAPTMGDTVPKKRPRSTSYTQSVKDGENPTAHTRRHEEKMEETGLIMADRQGAISDQCRELCKRILVATAAVPVSSYCRKKQLHKVLERLRYRNEARVVRDVTPLVVPSAELLHIGGNTGLQHAVEALNAQWDGIATLCGPMPKPAFVAGISPSAFTPEEKYRLKLHHTATCPNYFPENMYYPFLICEVKSSDKPIQEAERQAMHSASIAANAIIELYRKNSKASELNRKILTLSNSHNSSTVKFYGHFAEIQSDRVTFFRHRMYEKNFAADLADAVVADPEDETSEWWRPYMITTGIYNHFFPQHLERIRTAVSELRDRALESFTSQLGIESNGARADSQGLDSSVSSSQDPGQFKKPSHPSTVKLQRENEKLLELLLQQQEQQKQQLAQQKEEQREQKEMMQRQLAQQKEEQREQKEEQREQKEMLQRQLSQQERQLAQQKEEQREQKEMMDRQMAQQKEIIELLKPSG